jgi:hypothetical protein
MDRQKHSRQVPRIRVVKNRERKARKRTQRTMDRCKMLAGWNRAAEELMSKRATALKNGQVKSHNLLKPLSVEQAGMLAENQHRAMLARVGRPLGYKSDLIGAEFGRLLVWERIAELNRVPQYLCLCACGSAIAVGANLLIQKRKVSCQCVKQKSRRQRKWRVKKRLIAFGRKRRHASKFRASLAA